MREITEDKNGINRYVKFVQVKLPPPDLDFKKIFQITFPSFKKPLEYLFKKKAPVLSTLRGKEKYKHVPISLKTSTTARILPNESFSFHDEFLYNHGLHPNHLFPAEPPNGPDLPPQ